MSSEHDELRTRVSRIRTALTVFIPFFGHLLLKLEPRIVSGDVVATAGVTPDRKLLLNPDFCNKLTDAELSGLLVHEVLHPAMLCWERQGTRHAVVNTKSGRISLWNVAHDYAINMIIDEMIKNVPQVKLPDGACLDGVKYKDHSAEEIYDILLQQAIENGRGKGKGDGEGNTITLPNCPWGMDDIKDGDPTDGEGGGGSGDGDNNGPGKRWSDMSEAEKRAQSSYWKQAVVEAAQVHEQQKGRGDLPGSLQKMIDAIIDPKINWVDALSRWVGEHGRRADFTYTRPSRRSESIGEILPSMKKHGVDDIVVGWDTSGSMNGREKEILSEVIGICQDLAMTIRVICVDTDIHSDQSEVEAVEDIDIKGGGGSDYTPMFDRLHEEGYSGVVVCFTDGIIGVPHEKPPHIREVLWVLWERDTDPTRGRWGEVMQVDVEGNIVTHTAKAAAN